MLYLEGDSGLHPWIAIYVINFQFLQNFNKHTLVIFRYWAFFNITISNIYYEYLSGMHSIEYILALVIVCSEACSALIEYAKYFPKITYFYIHITGVKKIIISLQPEVLPLVFFIFAGPESHILNFCYWVVVVFIEIIIF